MERRYRLRNAYIFAFVVRSDAELEATSEDSRMALRDRFSEALTTDLLRSLPGLDIRVTVEDVRPGSIAVFGTAYVVFRLLTGLREDLEKVTKLGEFIEEIARLTMKSALGGNIVHSTVTPLNAPGRRASLPIFSFSLGALTIVAVTAFALAFAPVREALGVSTQTHAEQTQVQTVPAPQQEVCAYLSPRQRLQPASPPATASTTSEEAAVCFVVRTQ